MRKLRTLITGLLLCFGLSSCSQTSNISSDSVSFNSTPSDIDGGPHSRVVGAYIFKSFDDYLTFYNVFKNYNDERYWAPLSSDDFDVVYTFKSEGMYLDDVNAKRYDLDFQYQTMAVDISDSDFTLKMNLYNVFGRKLFPEQLSFSYRNVFHTSSLNIEFLLLCGDLAIGKGLFVSNTLDEHSNTKKLNNVLELMKGGHDYVF